jgi:hypothetical protein
LKSNLTVGNGKLKGRTAIMLAVVLTGLFAALCPSIDAGTSHPCAIDDDFDGAQNHYQAQCFYDDSGVLIYWIFTIYRTPEPEYEYTGWGSPVPIDTQKRDALGFPIPSTGPESLPPHSTAITGFPAVWETQKKYRGLHPRWGTPACGFDVADIVRDWEENQRKIENHWHVYEFVDGRISKVLPNWTSPFAPVFLRPSYVSSEAGLSQAEIVKQACGGEPGCDSLSRPDKYWMAKSIQEQFLSWSLKEIWETSCFPPSRTDYRPGVLNLKTIRIPLYEASKQIVGYWSSFWKDCHESTSAGNNFDGCQAELRDYVAASALEKASSKSYPTDRLAAKAMTIARAIDAGRHFHEATRELVPLLHPGKWWAAGAERDHLEPDDLPPETVKRIRVADHELSDAMATVKVEFNN